MSTETITSPAVEDDPRVSLRVTATHQTAIILTAVLAGALLATALVEAALGNQPTLWIEYHQATTAAYTRILPPIGGLALMAALATLAGSWRQPHSHRLLVAAVGCLAAGLTVTILVHFPMNGAIATWDPAAPPADWQHLRDRWLGAHAVRTASVAAALGLFATALLHGRRTAPGQGRPSDALSAGTAT